MADDGVNVEGLLVVGVTLGDIDGEYDGCDVDGSSLGTMLGIDEGLNDGDSVDNTVGIVVGVIVGT